MADRLAPIDRSSPQLFPPGVENYLPGEQLAGFMVDISARANCRLRWNELRLFFLYITY